MHHLLASILLISFALTALTSCDDNGLSPLRQRPGFGGTITVNPPWSPPDSLFDLRVIAFPNYPPDDILTEIAAGTALISEPLEFNVNTQSYLISAEGISGTFQYVVVAQQYGESILENWRAVGVFTLTNDWTVPSAITLNGSTYLPNIDITIDFYNLPPQPF